APTPADVAVEAPETLLPKAVHVVGERVPGLAGGREEGLEERAVGRPPLQPERAVMPTQRIVRRRRRAVLHAAEVGQAVRVVPCGQIRPGRPSLKVERVAPLE